MTLGGERPEVQVVTRAPWIRRVTVAPDTGHLIVTTRDWTRCWQVGEKEPVWTKPECAIVSPGDGDWVLLHRAETANVCSLATGREIRQWENVIASRRDRSTVWLCGPGGIEVWQANLSGQ